MILHCEIRPFTEFPCKINPVNPMKDVKDSICNRRGIVRGVGTRTFSPHTLHPSQPAARPARLFSGLGGLGFCSPAVVPVMVNVQKCQSAWHLPSPCMAL